MTTKKNKKNHGKKMGITRPRPDGGVKKRIAAKAKSQVSLQEFMSVNMAQYSTTVRTITFVMRLQKMKSGLLPKIFPYILHAPGNGVSHIRL